MELELNIKNLSNVLRSIETLPKKMAKKVYAKSFRASAQVFQKEARTLAPRGSGRLQVFGRKKKRFRNIHLYQMIKIKTFSRPSRGIWRLFVHCAARHAHLVEFGTKPHVIRKAQNINGKWVAQVDHPGSRAQPFMEPAFNRSYKAAIRAATLTAQFLTGQIRFDI